VKKSGAENFRGKKGKNVPACSVRLGGSKRPRNKRNRYLEGMGWGRGARVPLWGEKRRIWGKGYSPCRKKLEIVNMEWGELS